MQPLEEMTVACPYCGESITVLVDCSSGGQSYYEDCSVCCSPIYFTLLDDGRGGIEVIAERDD